MRETARMLDDGSFFEVHVPLDENEEALNHMNHKEVDGASYISQKRYFLAEPVRDLISGKDVEGRCRVTQLVLTTMEVASILKIILPIPKYWVNIYKMGYSGKMEQPYFLHRGGSFLNSATNAVVGFQVPAESLHLL